MPAGAIRKSPQDALLRTFFCPKRRNPEKNAIFATEKPEKVVNAHATYIMKNRSMLRGMMMGMMCMCSRLRRV